jgi:hypothetical protein
MEVITIEVRAYKELLQLIKEIKSSVDSKNRKQPLSDIWLDIQETCQLLKISKRTLQFYRDQKLISFSQINGKIYFKASDIDLLLQKHYKKAAEVKM